MTGVSYNHAEYECMGRPRRGPCDDVIETGGLDYLVTVNAPEETTRLPRSTV